MVFELSARFWLAEGSNYLKTYQSTVSATASKQKTGYLVSGGSRDRKTGNFWNNGKMTDFLVIYTMELQSTQKFCETIYAKRVDLPKNLRLKL